MKVGIHERTHICVFTVALLIVAMIESSRVHERWKGVWWASERTRKTPVQRLENKVGGGRETPTPVQLRHKTKNLKIKHKGTNYGFHTKKYGSVMKMN